jgi:hypothetical protein
MVARFRLEFLGVAKVKYPLRRYDMRDEIQHAWAFLDCFADLR